MRHTGIEIIGDAPWGTHFCQFYRDKQDLTDTLVPYFKAGLENNEFCMWIASEPLRVEEAKAALAGRVDGLDGYIRKGQIEILDYTEWYTTGGRFESERVLRGWVERLDAALKRGFDGLRLSGNTFWLEKPDWQDFTEYEAAVDSVIGQYPMMALCTYSLAKCGAVEIMDVVSNHAFALIKRAGKWQVVESAERRKIEASLRQSEERLQIAIESTGLGTWDLDPQTGKLVLSDMCSRHIGLPAGAGSDYAAFLRNLHPEDRQRVEQSVQKALRREAGGHFSAEYRTIGSEDGVERWILAQGRAHFDRAGRPVRFIGTTLDISERKKAEEGLLRAQKLESIAVLAGGVAHDFNNLLVGVIGNASLARETLPPAHEAVELLQAVINTGEQLAHLTRQMLAYSGQGRFLVEPLDLSDLVPEMSNLVQPSISKKIAFEYDLEPNLPPIEADRGQLQQIFMNLVINAAEAIGSHGGLITVKTGREALDEAAAGRNPEAGELMPGEYVYLQVRDTGGGMDNATKAKIFEPFFSTKFTGRGLGLAAVAGIVRSHKGAIRVASAPCGGTCFTVLFPALQGPAVRPATGRQPVQRGKGTVLVVDDERTVRELAKKALERYGYSVLEACSAASAIDTVKRHPGHIGLVLLDLSMPEMSGEEALPELRKIRPDIRVVVSSGYSEAETMALFRGQSISGFVQKPYSAARLLEQVGMSIVPASRQAGSGC